MHSEEGGSPRRSPNKPGELRFVAVLIVVSSIALWLAYAIAGFSKWSSPGVFPMLAAGTMLLSSLFIFRDAIVRRINRGSDDGVVDAVQPMPVLPIQVALVTLLLVMYVLAMPTLGFLLDSGLFLFACIAILWKRPWWQTLLVSAISLIAIHIIFRIVFQVILPEGTLIDAIF